MHYHNYRLFSSWQGKIHISVLHTIRLALVPNNSPFQMEPGAVSPKVGRPEHKADHSPPFNVKVKNEFTHTCTTALTSICLHAMYSDSFTFTVLGALTANSMSDQKPNRP